MEMKATGFSIEATSHCQDGRWPRWSWWIRGIANSARYGVIGTDETGHGLYIYTFRADRTAERQALLTAEAFYLQDGASRQQANALITEALLRLWGAPASRSSAHMPSLTAEQGFLRA